MKKIYEECLQEYGYEETFPKCDARILFNSDEKGITDILVARFDQSEKQQHLYKKFRSDIGNCLRDWNEWTLSDVLIKLLIFHNIDRALKIKLLLELSRIEEWRESVAPSIFRLLN